MPGSYVKCELKCVCVLYCSCRLNLAGNRRCFNFSQRPTTASGGSIVVVAALVALPWLSWLSSVDELGQIPSVDR